jgi:hypothetical protein
MVKNIADLESIGHVTIFTNPLTENTFWMWVLVARNTACDFDGTKFSFTKVAFITRDALMFAGQRKLRFSAMIEIHPNVNRFPTHRAMAALTIQ